MKYTTLTCLLVALSQAIQLQSSTNLNSEENGLSLGHCDPCATCSCPCPNLQDCGIKLPEDGTGFGTIAIGTDSIANLDDTTTITIPDILTNSATATNVCGLEVSARKECADNFKLKKFDIAGCIKVCEHECASGCEGERLCLDGRYTATQQRFTESGTPAPV